MHAIMLAAGRGIRLSNGAGHPKCLLEFGGKTLLRRHIEILESLGIDRLTIVVGFKADEIHAELAAIGPRPSGSGRQVSEGRTPSAEGRRCLRPKA